MRLESSSGDLSLPNAELTVVDGESAGTSARLKNGRLRVGSGENCELRLADNAVSRIHCEIRSDSSEFRIVDMHSTNGTWVDGLRVYDAILSPGALVRLGNTALRVARVDEPALVELSPRRRFGEILGGSVAMRRVYAVLEKAAVSDVTVLVQGETGTGKELVARALHERSRRRGGPFVAVDCGTIPTT